MPEALRRRNWPGASCVAVALCQKLLMVVVTTYFQLVTPKLNFTNLSRSVTEQALPPECGLQLGVPENSFARDMEMQQ